MDSVTQGLLGAAFGKAVAGPQLKHRAAWWGAFGGILPDLDFLLTIGRGPFAQLELHRGFTHALWFGPVAGSALGYALWRLYRRSYDKDPEGAPKDHPGAPKQLIRWVLVMVLSILTHPLLDLFTTYGTQLLAPFSNQRFAIDGVAIIDPAYSLVLLVGLLAYRRDPRRNQFASAIAIGLTTGYLMFTLSLNGRAEEQAATSYAPPDASTSAEPLLVDAYPTMFQPYLRRVIARKGHHKAVGFVSLWADTPVVWTYFDSASGQDVDDLLSRPEGQLFQWFAMERIHTTRTVQSDGTVLVTVEDLRYGMLETPRESLWAIEATYTSDGKPMGPVAFVRRARGPDMKASLGRLWEALTTGRIAEQAP